jgi:hypothetical protein
MSQFYDRIIIKQLLKQDVHNDNNIRFKYSGISKIYSFFINFINNSSFIQIYVELEFTFCLM